jgi:hypothetical protein
LSRECAGKFYRRLPGRTTNALRSGALIVSGERYAIEGQRVV